MQCVGFRPVWLQICWSRHAKSLAEHLPVQKMCTCCCLLLPSVASAIRWNPWTGRLGQAVTSSWQCICYINSAASCSSLEGDRLNLPLDSYFCTKMLVFISHIPGLKSDIFGSYFLVKWWSCGYTTSPITVQILIPVFTHTRVSF